MMELLVAPELNGDVLSPFRNVIGPFHRYFVLYESLDKVNQL